MALSIHDKLKFVELFQGILAFRREPQLVVSIKGGKQLTIGSPNDIILEPLLSHGGLLQEYNNWPGGYQ